MASFMLWGLQTMENPDKPKHCLARFLLPLVDGQGVCATGVPRLVRLRQIKGCIRRVRARFEEDSHIGGRVNYVGLLLSIQEKCGHILDRSRPVLDLEYPASDQVQHGRQCFWFPVGLTTDEMAFRR